MSDRAPLNAPVARVVREIFGSVASLAVVGPLREEGVEAAFDRLHEIDARLSPYRIDSEVSRIRDGALPLAEAHPETRWILAVCEALREESGGIFDARIAGIDGRLDPSGYVKGWAIGEAHRILIAAGMENCALGIGGDVAASGEGPGGAGWVVGVANGEVSASLGSLDKIVRRNAHPTRISRICFHARLVGAPTGCAVRPASPGSVMRIHTCARRPADLALASLLVAAPLAAQAPATAAAPAKDIVDTAVAAGSFKTLATALQAAGLVETLKGKGPFTVFAPTDEAFAKIPKAQLDALLKDKKALAAVLTYHVVAGKVLAADVVKLKEAKTVNGAAAKIMVNGGKVMVDGANVVKTDIIASNGVIHVVDTVLMPS